MDPEEKRAAEMRLLYQSSLDNIDYLKRRQWYVVYYAILLYAALFALATHEPAPNTEPIARDLLFGATWLVALVSVFLIHKFQTSLVEDRKRTVRIINQEFAQETKDIRPTDPDEDAMYTSYYYDRDSLGLFFGTSLIGAVFVSRVICPDAACI